MASIGSAHATADILAPRIAVMEAQLCPLGVVTVDVVGRNKSIKSIVARHWFNDMLLRRALWPRI
jgi:hypothetical protein